tara:strand:+ start:11653 stop:12096 length:444 start_codon:yes stop_codon:yes gene_type:complete
MNLAKMAMNNRHKDPEVIREFNFSGIPNSLISKLKGNFPYSSGEQGLPLAVIQKPSWEIFQHKDSMVMKKSYKFPALKHLLYFVNKCMKESRDMHHFPEITIKENVVAIILYTQGVNDVTEQDTQLAKIFDDVFDEVKLIHRSRNDN